MDVPYCAYCHKKIEGRERPFIPVRSSTTYHWKCYIQKIKEESVPLFLMEESEDRLYSGELSHYSNQMDYGD